MKFRNTLFSFNNIHGAYLIPKATGTLLITGGRQLFQSKKSHLKFQNFVIDFVIQIINRFIMVSM